MEVGWVDAGAHELAKAPEVASFTVRGARVKSPGPVGLVWDGADGVGGVYYGCMRDGAWEPVVLRGGEWVFVDEVE